MTHKTVAVLLHPAQHNLWMSYVMSEDGHTSLHSAQPYEQAVAQAEKAVTTMAGPTTQVKVERLHTTRETASWVSHSDSREEFFRRLAEAKRGLAKPEGDPT